MIIKASTLIDTETGEVKGAWTYITIYLEDRAYGGPEEGGWWFDAGIPVSMVDLSDSLREKFDRLIESEPILSHVANREDDGYIVSVYIETDCVQSICSAAKKVEAVFDEICHDINSTRNSDINSVLSEGMAIIYSEPTYPESYPRHRPHYE